MKIQTDVLYRSCQSKRKYPSEQAAVATINSLTTDKSLRTYKCKFCSGFHLTSSFK